VNEKFVQTDSLLAITFLSRFKTQSLKCIDTKGDIMLTRFIVSSYALLIEVSLWIFLLGSLIAGWSFGKFMGAVLGLIVGGVVAIMFFGAFLVLEDIRKSIRTIEQRGKM
jgi:hypothetical protein